MSRRKPDGPSGLTDQGRKFLKTPVSTGKTAPLPKNSARNYTQTFKLKQDKPQFVIERDNDNGARERLTQSAEGAAIVTEEISAATGERAVWLPTNGEVSHGEVDELIHANAQIPDDRERPDDNKLNKHFRNDIDFYANQDETSRRKTFSVPAMPWK
jgi:hypothetical protein